jgi:hypothetical protein
MMPWRVSPLRRLAPSGIVSEQHLLSGVGEKIPELDGPPLDAVEVLQDAESDFPLVLAKVVADVINCQTSVASSMRRDKICCAPQQFENVHSHILGRGCSRRRRGLALLFRA